MTKGISWHYLLLNYTTGESYYGHTSEHIKGDRFKSSEYTKVLARWIARGDKWEPIWFEIPEVGSHLDKRVHPHLDRCLLLESNPTRGTNEFFQLIDPRKCEEYIKEVENIVIRVFGTGARRERKVLSLRYPQQLFRDKYITKDGKFLLAANMRTGKVVMTASKIVDDNIKYSLIISRRNSPEQSWKEDIEKFDKFENLYYIRLGDNGWKKDLENAVKLGKQIIFYTTAQYLIKRLNVLDDYKIEFLAFDEVHVGGKANEVVKIRDYFNDAQQLDFLRSSA